MLQSESADEEDEHFEDIVEEADDRPGSASGKQETDGEPVENGGAAVPDGDSSEDGDETTVLASEDEASDEADEFLVRDDAEDVNEGKTMSVSSGKQSQASSKKSSLPGGYDPRHREPSYWWVLSSKLFFLIGSLLSSYLSGYLSPIYDRDLEIEIAGSATSRIGNPFSSDYHCVFLLHLQCNLIFLVVSVFHFCFS